jgi:hypothetical protein
MLASRRVSIWVSPVAVLYRSERRYADLGNVHAHHHQMRAVRIARPVSVIDSTGRDKPRGPYLASRQAWAEAEDLNAYSNSDRNDDGRGRRVRQ